LKPKKVPVAKLEIIADSLQISCKLILFLKMIKTLLTFLSLLIAFSGLGQNLSVSLTACYNFNGNTIDAVNNLNGGFISTTLVVAPDRFNSPNSAIKIFSGSSVTALPSDPLIKPDNNLSFSGWVRFNTLSNYAPVIITRNTVAASSTANMEAYQLALKLVGGNFRFVASKSNSSNSSVAVSTTQVTNNIWYHVAFTMDSSAIKLYVNGVLESSVVPSFFGFDYLSGGKVTAGYLDQPSFYNPMNGFVDNFKFYNRALSTQEINALFLQDPECFPPPSPPTCGVYYALSVASIYAYLPGPTPTPTYVNVLIPEDAYGITVARNFGFVAPNPTYWITAGGNLWYFDGTSFVNTNHSQGNAYSHSIGSSANFIYSYDKTNAKVYKYNGTGNATTVATYTNNNFTSDIVGDDLDNFYLQHNSSQSLYKYNSNGAKICEITNITAYSGQLQGLSVIDNSVTTIGGSYFSYTPISPHGAMTLAYAGVSQAGINDLGNCPLTTSITITMQPPQAVISCINPSVTIHVHPSLNDFYTYSWNGPPSTTPAVFTATAPGIYTISLSGCRTPSGSATYTVSYTNNSLSLTPVATPSMVCLPGNSTTLSVTGGNSYTWSPSAGLSSTTGSQVVASPPGSTVYTVSAVGAGTCTGSSTLQIITFPSPNLQVAASVFSLCVPGPNAILTASGATAYTWSPNFNLSAPTGSQVVASPNVSTIYTVSGQASNGCSNNATLQLSVFPAPALSVSLSANNVCAGESVTVVAKGGSSYSWSPGALNGSQNILFPQSSSVYTIVGISAEGCSSIKQLTINVESCLNLNEMNIPGLLVWPNPTNGELYLSENFSQEFIYSIYGITGEKFLNGVASKKIDVSDLPPGIYLLQIKIQNLPTYFNKIIKE
jgi:hypothetical protein